MSIINNRYSVRKFSKEEVGLEKINNILEGAMTAPSSKNKNPWEFIVIDNKEILKELSYKHKNWSILKNANKAILVCGNLNDDDREHHVIMTCSASTQNILLKAVELNLGAVWLGCYPDNKRIDIMRKEFNLPQYILPVSIVALGYKDNEENKMRSMNKSKIHYNGWENF